MQHTLAMAIKVTKDSLTQKCRKLENLMEDFCCINPLWCFTIASSCYCPPQGRCGNGHVFNWTRLAVLTLPSQYKHCHEI